MPLNPCTFENEGGKKNLSFTLKPFLLETEFIARLFQRLSAGLNSPFLVTYTEVPIYISVRHSQETKATKLLGIPQETKNLSKAMRTNKGQFLVGGKFIISYSSQFPEACQGAHAGP